MKSVLSNNIIKIEFDFKWIFAQLMTFNDPIINELAEELDVFIYEKSFIKEFSTLPIKDILIYL